MLYFLSKPYFMLTVVEAVLQLLKNEATVSSVFINSHVDTSQPQPFVTNTLGCFSAWGRKERFPQGI